MARTASGASPDTHYDCIVVGTGGMGSATLFELAKRGARVLGVDQYGIAHDKGSSHGDTRAIRLVYFEHPDYVPLLRRAFEKWDALQESWNTPLFTRTGILQAGPAGGEVLTGLIEAAAAHNLPMEQLSAADVSSRFDGFTIPPEDQAIFDPNGGILRVEACVEAFMELASRHGAQHLDHTAVRHWYARRDSVVVETDAGTFSAGKLVITPGAWAPALLPELSCHLQILRKSLFWFEAEDDCYQAENGCPVFLFERHGQTYYGFPTIDEKGIKIAEHSGGRPVDSPAALDRHVDTGELEGATLTLKHYLPRAGHQLNHHTTCLYTMSSDGHFIVGKYPGMENVFVVAGLSGHGYKFASVLGEVMADLALEGATSLPVQFLGPERFQVT